MFEDCKNLEISKIWLKHKQKTKCKGKKVTIDDKLCIKVASLS